MTRRTRRTRTVLGSIAAATAMTLVGAGLAGAAPAAKPKPKAPKNPAATQFTMKGWGYGSRIVGGQVPGDTGASAYEGIGCTNEVNRTRTNTLGKVVLPGLGTVDGLATRVWTSREGKAVSIYSRNTLGTVTLSDSPLGTLTLEAVSTTARAFHDGTRFRTETQTDLGRLRFRPPAGPPVTLALPKPGDPVVIPGFATVALAHSRAPKTAHGARVFANGIRIKLHSSGSVVRMARAVAQISTELKSGILAGRSYAVTGKALGDVLQLGRNALVKMPCQGTKGEVRSRKLAGLDLAGQAVLAASQSRAMGNQNARRAWGWQESSLGTISLGGGALEISGVVGKVNVSRKVGKPGKLVRNANGTRIGSLVVNGEAQELPLDQVLEIPGLAKLEPKVVTDLPNGISVTALRITFLDGTGGVLELGNARLQIRRLPLPKKR